MACHRWDCMVSRLALVTSFRMAFYMKECNPLASLPRSLSLTNSITRSPGVYQDRQYIQTAGSLIQDACILWHAHSPRWVFSLTSTAALLLPSVKGRLKPHTRLLNWGYFQNLVHCASQLLFLLSFGSAYSLPTVYRYSVLNIKAEAKMKKNHCKLDHSNSLKTLAHTQDSLPSQPYKYKYQFHCRRNKGIIKMMTIGPNRHIFKSQP